MAIADKVLLGGVRIAAFVVTVSSGLEEKKLLPKIILKFSNFQTYSI
jgi:hypothetical protein